MLVLLDLSAAFDIIDLVILFDRFVKYVSFKRQFLDFIKILLFRTYTKILSEFAKNVYESPQVSV